MQLNLKVLWDRHLAIGINLGEVRKGQAPLSG